MLPDAGDVAWVYLDQTEGTEQSGRRPGRVLSNRAYHERSRRALVCPISKRIAPWFFNVPLAEGMITQGTVLVDQLRSIDRESRMFQVIERAPDSVVAEVLAKLSVLIGIEPAS
jgi:mRNA interferase MazF